MGTGNGVYTVDTLYVDYDYPIMMVGKRIYSVKLINNQSIICGTHRDGYYLLDIINGTEQ